MACLDNEMRKEALCAGFLTWCLMHARCHSVYNATSLTLYLHFPACQREWVFPFFYLLFLVLPLLLEEPGWGSSRLIRECLRLVPVSESLWAGSKGHLAQKKNDPVY